MPGQEKMVLEYYQKNPSASKSLKGSLYEEKIIELIKSKINLTSKEINTKEAEKIITDFNKPNSDIDKSKTSSATKNKTKPKKISKK
jgi:trigger factor